MTDIIANPLSEADSKSLDEIFSANPESLSDNEILQMISKFRDERTKWSEAEMLGKTKGRKSFSAKPAPVKINLDDLGEI